MTSKVSLILGDCMTAELPKSHFRLMLTDPPYSRAGSMHSGRWSTAGKLGDAASGDQFWEHWFRDCLRAMAPAMRSDACAVFFCDYRTIHCIDSSVPESMPGWAVTQCWVWDRDAMGLGSPLRASYEMIAFARGPDWKWDGPKDVKNVIRERWVYGKHEHHPAEKPVALLRRLVDMFASSGPVLDPFAGSGSTLVACAEAGVPAVGVEANAEIASVAAKRLGVRRRIFAPTVVREDYRGQLYLMSGRERGWMRQCVPVASLGDLLLEWAVRLGESGEDKDGRYWEVIPEAA